MLRILLVCSCTACQESFIMDFRMAFLSEFSKDKAPIRWSYRNTPNWSDAGDLKATISLVWRQFQLEQEEVTSRRLGAAWLVNFLDCLTVFREKISQNDTSHSSERPKQHNTELSWHFVWFFIEFLAFKLHCRANHNRRRVLTRELKQWTFSGRRRLSSRRREVDDVKVLGLALWWKRECQFFILLIFVDCNKE